MVRQTSGAEKRSGAERRKGRRVPASIPFRLVSNGKEETFELVDRGQDLGLDGREPGGRHLERLPGRTELA